jgi:hypothetical protein
LQNHPGFLVYGFLRSNDFTYLAATFPQRLSNVRGSSGPLKAQGHLLSSEIRGNSPTPTAVILQPDIAWQWITKNIHNKASALEAHFAVNENKLTPYKPKLKAAEMSQEEIPRLICIPSALASVLTRNAREHLSNYTPNSRHVVGKPLLVLISKMQICLLCGAWRHAI